MKELPDSASKLLFINRLLLSQSVLKNQKKPSIYNRTSAAGAEVRHSLICVLSYRLSVPVKIFSLTSRFLMTVVNILILDIH